MVPKLEPSHCVHPLLRFIFYYQPSHINNRSNSQEVWKDSTCSGYSHAHNLTYTISFWIVLSAVWKRITGTLAPISATQSWCISTYLEICVPLLFLWARNTARAGSCWCHGAQKGRHKTLRCCHTCQINPATRPDQPMLPAASLHYAGSSLVHTEMAMAVGEISTERRDKSSLFKTKWSS